MKMLLENYGYHIVDLGRDVGPETVVEAALRTGAPLVGLSSLMTTTAQNIAVTIRALREAGAQCKGHGGRGRGHPVPSPTRSARTSIPRTPPSLQSCRPGAGELSDIAAYILFLERKRIKKNFLAKLCFAFGNLKE